jgi:dihydrodipicolinate reductase
VAAIRVCVAGITGWTGRPVADAVEAAPDLELVAGVSLPDPGLSIRHDAGETAEPYIAGTLVAIRTVLGRVELTRGLDQLLPRANA